MEQPLDFSKSTTATTATTIKTPSLTVKKQLQRFNNMKSSLKNLTKQHNDYHLNNSENSDENTSRSSTSSPDSLENEQQQLNLNSALNSQLSTGHSTLSQDALIMLAFNSQLLMNSGKLNSLTNFNNSNSTSNQAATAN